MRSWAIVDLTGHTVLITGCGPTGLFAAAVARTGRSRDNYRHRYQ